MGILKKISPLALPILLTGCYEDFIPKIDTKPVLCINSLITAGNPIEVKVTHTWEYADVAGDADHSVTDADIKIFANGEPQEDDYLPKEGDIIKITAESPTYGHAEAETRVPESVPIEALDWEANVTDYREWADIDDVFIHIRFNLVAKLTITDPANQMNYYQFSYRTSPEEEEGRLDAGNFYYEGEPIFSEHIGMLDAISGYDAYGFTFFTDRQFSGTSYTLNLRFNDMIFNINKRNVNADALDCDLELYLSSISPSFYNWCDYCWNAEYGTISDLGDIGLGDPIWGYSNVSSGAGIVAAQTLEHCTINLKDLLMDTIIKHTK